MSEDDDGKEGYEKPLKLDMAMEEAMNRFANVTKEELAEQQQVSSDDMIREGDAQMALFKGKEIRQVFHDNEWFFSIVDVIEAIVGTDRPSKYWSDLKKQLIEKEGYSELSEEIGKLPMPSADGKSRPTDAVNTETLFRIVQSIPSKTAEPFKKWLAKVGYERIQEIQNPEIAIKRAMLTYKAKGYEDDWIKSRVQTIVSRKELTREWSKRGINKGLEYALLTDAISQETFNLKTKQHKKYKGLKDHHVLRDHMTPLELALTMLGETATAEIARNTDAQGFNANESAAKSGGRVAGRARHDIEHQLGKKVVTDENYLPESKQKRLSDKK